jgi:hypothetical protein
MTLSLSQIGLPKTDHSDAGFGLDKAQYVQPPIKIPNGHDTVLAVLAPRIRRKHSAAKIEIRRPLEGQASLQNIASVLGGIEANIHLSNYTDVFG